MKKINGKKIIGFILIFIFVVASLGTAYYVKAVGSDIGTGGSVDSYCKASSAYCYTTNMPMISGGSKRINGIRITIVDTNGNRVSNSIDVVNNANIAGTSTELGAGQLQYKDTYGSLKVYNVNSLRTRNEVLGTGIISGTNFSGKPTVYYWSKLEDFVETNGANNLRDFFTTLSDRYPEDLSKLLSLLNYNDLSNIENHYMLIETLLYTRIFSSTTDGGTSTKGVYYGTGSEVYAMLKHDGYANAGMFKTLYPLSIHTLNRYQDNNTYTSTAGLSSIQAIKSGINNWADYMMTNYGLAAGHVWMKDIAEPGLPEVPSTPNVQQCNTTPSVNLTNNCESSKSGSVLDTTDWSCIYSQINSSANTFNGRFYNDANGQKILSNSYCNVACREEISYNFSGNDLVVDAGHRFAIGNSGSYGNVPTLNPVSFTGKSICRTAYRTGTTNPTINVEQFVKDYQDINAKILNAYNDWQNWEAKQLAATTACNNKTASGAGSYRSTSAKHGCAIWNYEWQTDYSNPKAYTQNRCTRKSVKGAWSCSETTTTTCSSVKTDLLKVECTATEYNLKQVPTTCNTWEDADVNNNQEGYTIYYFRDTRYYNGNYFTEEAQIGSDGRHISCPNYSGIVAQKRSYYYSLIAQRTNMMNQIRTCNNFVRQYEEFDPKVAFNYSERNYASSYQLDASSGKSAITYYYKGSQSSYSYAGSKSWSVSNSQTGTTADTSSVYAAGAQIIHYNCPGNFGLCTNVTITYPTVDWVEQVTTKNYNYTLPANIYRYVNKDGVSFNKESDAIASGFPYLDIGYSNLPVSYSTKEGRYPYTYEFYSTINGEKNLFGKNQKYFNQFTSLFTPSATKYQCTYYVNEEFIGENPDDCSSVTTSYPCCKVYNTCPTPSDPTIPTGLNVIYRTISLDDPFPAYSGDGRVSGSNWKDNISAYITNNRGVTTEEVYGLTPMYQFVLAPSNIRAIRRYNNQHNKDYNDYNLTCNGKTGENCTSSFLSEGLAQGYFKFTNANPTGGSCFGAGPYNWESCRK